MQVSDDALQIAADFNHLKQETGAEDELVINLLYQLAEARKAALAPIERILEWPVQN